jgi:hypothetical protein
VSLVFFSPFFFVGAVLHRPHSQHSLRPHSGVSLVFFSPPFFFVGAGLHRPHSGVSLDTTGKNTAGKQREQRLELEHNMNKSIRSAEPGRVARCLD